MDRLYSKQHAYADNIEFEQVINVIQKIKEIIINT